MLLNLNTGRVAGYDEGQAPLIYLVTSVERVQEAGCQFVFSDGHGLATFTDWYDNVDDLDRVDWSLVAARYWADTPEDNDRQRRKQAEFLVWQSLDWALIEEIAVISDQVKAKVEAALGQCPHRHQPCVRVRGPWYY